MVLPELKQVEEVARQAVKHLARRQEPLVYGVRPAEMLYEAKVLKLSIEVVQLFLQKIVL